MKAQELEVKMFFDMTDADDARKFREIMAIYAPEDDAQPASAPAPKRTVAAKPTPAPAPAPAEQAEQAPAQVSSSGLTLADLRSLMAEKQEHRSALKAKLTELGAPNLKALAEDKYQEFHDFMKTL